MNEYDEFAAEMAAAGKSPEEIERLWRWEEYYARQDSYRRQQRNERIALANPDATF